MISIGRDNQASRPSDVARSWHQSVERNASMPSIDSSAIYWRWQYVVHGGRSSRVNALCLAVKSGGTSKLDRSNFFGAFKALRSLIASPLQFRQEPKSGLAYCLKAFRWVLLHGFNHGAINVGKVRKERGDARNA